MHSAISKHKELNLIDSFYAIWDNSIVFLLLEYSFHYIFYYFEQLNSNF